MAKTKFDLSTMLETVSDLGTAAGSREQIEYIDIDRIDDDPNNFYELSSLDELAANIELLGLQQPIRVRTNPQDADRVIIVSGHRRRAAIRKLVEDGRTDMREIPCIRERSESSSALQELRLIYANSDTRKLTSAEISKQAERVEILLYQLKEEGYEFPGRMRDHVAEACKVSKSKLARLKVIREKLGRKWMPHYESGSLNESTAYTLAQMSAVHQRYIYDGVKARKEQIKWFYEYEAKRYGAALAAAEKACDKLACEATGGACDHLSKQYEHICASEAHNRSGCKGCCSKCENLATCRDACPHLKDRIKQLRADASAQRKQKQLALEEKQRPTIMEIQNLWRRFGQARAAAGKSVREVYKAAGMYYAVTDDDKVAKMESLTAKFTVNTTLPYGYGCTLSEVQKFVKMADLLGVSLDYLLCRTDEPAMSGSKDQPASTGDDRKPALTGAAWYPTSIEPENGQEIVTVDDTGYASDDRYVAGNLSYTNWEHVAFWTPFPRDATAMEIAAQGRWVPGDHLPEMAGECVAVLNSVVGGHYYQTVCYFDGEDFCFGRGCAPIKDKVIRWMPLPPAPEEGNDA